MGIATVGRFVAVAVLTLVLPLRALADPPQLVIGAAGPMVQGHESQLSSIVADSQRGLSIPTADIDIFQPDFVPPQITMPEPGTPVGFNISTSSSGYRLFRTETVNEMQADGGYKFDVRVGSGSVLATGTGATRDAARAAALANPALDTIRAYILTAQEVVLAATQTITETVNSIVTGYDDYVSTGEVIFGPTTVRVGFLGECATPFSTCASGQNLVMGLNDTLTHVYTLRDTYITDAISRVVTTVQNYALNLTLDADAPLILGTAGPEVVGLRGPLPTTVFSSERDLDAPLSSVAYLQPGFVPNPQVWPTAPYPDTGGILYTTTSFGYQLQRQQEVTETAADGGYSFAVRVGVDGPVLATGTGPTIEAARAAALASPALNTIRGSIVAMQEAVLAATRTVAETVTSVLTGRDTYITAGQVIFGPTTVNVGYLDECSSAFDDCAAPGQQVVLGLNDTLVNIGTLEVLHITDRISRLVTTIQNYAVNLTLDESSDPPPLTGPAGPLVQSPGGSLTSTLIVSERGLAIPVQAITDLVPQYVLNGVTETIGRDGSASYAPDSGSFTPTPEPGHLGEFVATSTFAYTATTRQVNVTQERDGGVRLQARVAGSGTTIATTMAATLDQAVETMLALPQVAAVAFERYEVAANGVSQTSETTSATVLTGRDTYTSTGLVVFGPDQLPIGNLGRCTVATTDCEGGITLNLSEHDSLSLVYIVQDLYLTETVTTVITTLHDYVMTLVLAGADGTPHVAAQQVGLAGGEGFLGRMLAEARARATVTSDVTRSSMGGALADGDPRAFAAFSAATGSLDAFGLASSSDWTRGTFTGGFTYAVASDWTLGVALDLGQWSWEGGASRADGESRKLGIFAGYERQDWHLGFSGFVGQDSVKSRDAFGATASYDVATRGLAAELGYGFRQGDWTLTPSLGARWVNWDAPQVTDSAGNVIEAANISQLQPELGFVARRSFATAHGPLDLQLDARLWGLTGDRAAAGTLGMIVQGPKTGNLEGSLGITAIWQLADDSALSLHVKRTFSATGPETEGSIALQIRF